mgnify:CR=1 FL=1
MKYRKNVRQLLILSIVAIIGAVLLYREIAFTQQGSAVLQITSPSDGTVVAPGETIPVVVDAAAGINAVAVLGNGLAAGPSDAGPPFVLQLSIPADHSPKERRTIALAPDWQGGPLRAAPSTLKIELPNSQAVLSVRPSLINFQFIGARRQLQVNGRFSDGSLKTLNRSGLTVFNSNNPNVAEVNASGLVKATGPGEAVITVQYRDLSSEVPVTVPDELSPDDDGDGISNGTDNCPQIENPNQENTDKDLWGDVCDECSNDAAKRIPAICGCGVPDTDSDGDGPPDCNDQCPNDPARTAPSPEVCNGADDNCNGTIDENNPGGGASCSTNLPGVCSTGALTCANGGLSCQQTTQPSAESCDGLDNNCNGQVDDGLSCNTGYTFTGFFAPVDNNGVLNKANAGQSIPVKWRLLDASGAAISDPASFVSLTSSQVSCATLNGGSDEVEEYTAGSSGLQYLGDGNWQFNWKTPKTYAGQCRVMRLNLADEAGKPTTRTANFQFK